MNKNLVLAKQLISIAKTLVSADTYFPHIDAALESVASKVSKEKGLDKTDVLATLKSEWLNERATEENMPLDHYCEKNMKKSTYFDGADSKGKPVGVAVSLYCMKSGNWELTWHYLR